ncbi:MAG TPA: hypothetical protein VH637_13245 [Streptosporangiaceae bacterium]|jgi:hypothetical protein
MAPPTQPQQPPGGRTPAPDGAAARRARPLPVIAAFTAMVAGTAALGVITGLIWAAVAPRAQLVVVSRGAAGVVNPETSAFIVADAWFVGLTVIAGVVSGLAGYLLAVRRHGPVAMAGVLIGALAGSLLARWAGEQPGAASYHHLLAVSKPGAALLPPLMLGGVGALAFWPLAAGLTAGGIEAARYLRERRRMLSQQSPLPPPGQPGLAAWVPPRARKEDRGTQP